MTFFLTPMVMPARLVAATTRRFSRLIIGLRSMGSTQLLTTESFCAAHAMAQSMICESMLLGLPPASLLTLTRIACIGSANRRIGLPSQNGSRFMESRAKQRLRKRNLSLLRRGNSVAARPHPNFPLDRGWAGYVDQ